MGEKNELNVAGLLHQMGSDVASLLSQVKSLVGNLEKLQEKFVKFEEHINAKELHNCGRHDKRLAYLEEREKEITEKFMIEKGEAKGKKWVYNCIYTIVGFIAALVAFKLNILRLASILVGG